MARISQRRQLASAEGPAQDGPRPLRRARHVVIVTLLAGIVLCAAAPAASAIDITGSWHLPAGSVADQTWNITSGTSTISGEGHGGPYTWPMEGNVNGNSVQIKTAYRGSSYTAYFVGTVSADCNTMSGTWDTTSYSSAAHSSQTWVANRTSGSCGNPNPNPNPTPTGNKPSKTQVVCDYIVADAQDTCTAIVGDATGQGTMPTGTVRFSSANGGVFVVGDTCNLVQHEGEVGVANCSVQFIPPENSPLKVTGNYSGDSNLQPSSGTTQFLFAAPGNGVYQQHIQNFNPPTISFNTTSPARGTKVSVSGQVTSGLGDDAVCGAPGSNEASTAAVASRLKAFKAKPVYVVRTSFVRRNVGKGKKVRVKLHFNPNKLRRAFPGTNKVQVLILVTLKPPKARAVVLYQRKIIKLHEPGHARRASTSASAIAAQAQTAQYTFTRPGCNEELKISAPLAASTVVSISWTNIKALCYDMRLHTQNSNSDDYNPNESNSGSLATLTGFVDQAQGGIVRGYINYETMPNPKSDSGYSWHLFGDLGQQGGSVSGGVNYYGIDRDGSPIQCSATAPGALVRTG